MDPDNRESEGLNSPGRDHSPLEPDAFTARWFGDPATTTLDYRFYFITTALASLGGILALALYTLVYPVTINAAGGAFVAGSGAGLYIVGRRLERPERFSHIILLLMGVVLGALWFENDGANGPVPVWYAPTFIGAAIVLTGRTRGWTLLTLFAIAVAAVAAQLTRPEWVTGHLTGTDRAIEISIGMLFMLGICVIVSVVVAQTYRDEQARVALLTEQRTRDALALEASHRQVEQLQELLPICAHCKKIRDDDGDWHQLETYLHDKQGTDFSHGICPDCVKEHYPHSAPT